MRLTRILAAAAAACAVAIATVAFAATPISKNQYEQAYERIIDQVRDTYVQPGSAAIDWATLKTNYGANINSAQELRRAVAATLKAGRDADLRLLSIVEADKLDERLRTSSVGVGLSLDTIRLVDRSLKITEVAQDTTAEEAGLKVGDEIIAVDGIDVALKELYESTKIIGGDAGTYVKLSIERAGVPIEISVMRDLDKRIGITVQPEATSQVFVVKYLDKDGPAAAAGLADGDWILGIGKQATGDLSVNAALSAIGEGRPGSTVTLTVERDMKVFDVTVTRKYIRNESMAFDMRGSYSGSNGYLLFTLKALDDPWLLEPVDSFITYFEESQNVKASGMVIDLRGTRGDNPDLAAKLAARFVTSGKLFSYNAGSDSNRYKVEYELKNGELVKTYTGAINKTVIVELPPDMVRYQNKVVIAVDGNTSGTAEALALALQASGRAKVTGAPTEAQPTLSSDIRESVDAGETVVVTVPSVTLTKADGSTMAGVTPDTRVYYSGDIIDTALTQVDSETWRSVENRTTIVAVAAGIVSLLLVLMITLVGRGKKDEEPEQEVEAEEETAPEPEETAEQESRSRWPAVAALAAMVLMVGALFGSKYAVDYSMGAPKGTHAEMLVVAYVDDSVEGKMQAKIVEQLAAEYTGDIKFQIIDASVHPELAVHPHWGKVESFPRISLNKDWVDAKGNRNSENQSMGPPMTKHDLIRYIESSAKSYRAFWPDANISRTRPSHP